MIISEYKKKKLDEIDYFLRGIIYKIKYSRDKNGALILDENGARIIEKRIIGLANIEFNEENDLEKNKKLFEKAIRAVNHDKEWRDLFEELIKKIYSLRLRLRHYDSKKQKYEGELAENKVLDEITKKEDVDKVVDNFINNVIKCLEEFKMGMLTRICDKDERLISELLGISSLASFKIVLGDRAFSLEEKQKNAKVRKQDDVIEENSVDNLESIILYIYSLSLDLKEKKNTIVQAREIAEKERVATNELKGRMEDFINQLLKSNIFEINSKQGYMIKRYWGAIFNSKSSEQALKEFEDFIIFLKNELDRFWKAPENMASNNADVRYNMLNDMYKLAREAFFPTINVEEKPKGRK